MCGLLVVIDSPRLTLIGLADPSALCAPCVFSPSINTYCLLLATYYLLPTTYDLLLTVYYITYDLLPTTYLPPTIYYVLVASPSSAISSPSPPPHSLALAPHASPACY